MGIKDILWLKGVSPPVSRCQTSLIFHVVSAVYIDNGTLLVYIFSWTSAKETDLFVLL